MIKYTRGNAPPESGVYACRVQTRDYALDMFLFWDGGAKVWRRLHNNERYPAKKVIAWAGPLERGVK